MRLVQAVELFLAAREHVVASQTLRNNKIYLRYLQDFFPAAELAAVTLLDLRRWRASLFEKNVKYENANVRAPVRAPLSRYTIRGIVETCRQFFNWCVNEGLLDASPAKRLEIPSVPAGPPRAVNDVDLEKLLDAARDTRGTFRRARNVALVLFLRDTGCRIGGASSLRVEHLDLPRKRALVKEKGRGGGKVRAVFFKDETACALQEWLALHPGIQPRRAAKRKGIPPRAGEFVFVSERYPYGPLSTQSLYCVFKQLKKKAGVRGRTNPHGLRHRRAKTLLQNGAPLGLVSRLLGHADVRTTDKFYGIYADEELRDGYDKYA